MTQIVRQMNILNSYPQQTMKKEKKKKKRAPLYLKMN